jgi:cytoskeleton protein RodZ
VDESVRSTEMDELGLILQEARENKGLTLQEVQEQTRINASYLEALENGEYSALPSPVHVRGFLRNYARFLDLDPDPLLERYKQSESYEKAPVATDRNGEIGPDAPLPSRQDQPFFDPVNVEVDAGSRRDPESAVRLIIIAALIIAVALIVNRFLPLVLNNEDGSEAITEGITNVVEDIVNNSEGLVPGEEAAATIAEEETENTTQENSEVITSTSRTNEAVEILPTPSPTRPALPATLEEINLKVEVTERSWFESTIDGEVMFTGIARPGDTFEWTAAEEAKLLTGNAIGLFVTVNDIPLGRLGDRGQNKEEVWRTTE